MSEQVRPFVWLASYPKSGNTWVRLFLAAMKAGDVDPNDMPLSACHVDTNAHYYQSVSPKPLDVLDQYDLLSLRWAVLQHIKTFSPWPLVVKTHMANVVSEVGPLIPDFLTAGIIYLVRDPRDVAVSLANHGGTSIDKAIERLCNPAFALGSEYGPFSLCADWSTHVHSYAQTEKPVLVVKYEDLAMHPEQQFKRILDFLEWENRRYFKDALKATKFSILSMKEQASGFREAKNGAFFRKGQPGEWKFNLSSEQEQAIISAHGEVMRSAGYL